MFERSCRELTHDLYREVLAIVAGQVRCRHAAADLTQESYARVLAAERGGVQGVEKDVFSLLPGLTLTGGVAYNSKAFVDNANTYPIPAWTRLDAGLRYAAKWAERPVTLRLNVENLTDKDYWGSVDRGFLYTGQPRTVSLSATMDF